MRRVFARKLASSGRSVPGWRIVLSGLVVGVVLMAPAAAMGRSHGGDPPINGKSTGVASADISTNPSPLTVSSTGHLSHLGAFVAFANEWFTPLGPSPVIPYTITGTETLVFANSDKLLGSVNGTGVNNSGAVSGTNVVTITGGTGGLAGVTGSFTESYTGQIFGEVGTSLVAPVRTIIRGQISLAGGYCDPLQGPADYCDPLQPSGTRDHRAGHSHHRHRHRNHAGG